MDNQLVLAVVGGAVVSVLLAVGIGDSMTDGKIKRALERAQEETASAAAGAEEALEARLAALEAALGESAAAASAQLEDRLATLEAETTAGIEDLAADVGEQAAALEALAGEIAALADADPGSSAAPDFGPDMMSSQPLGVGQTAIFADGAVRAFVSAINQQIKVVRLSVNGVLWDLEVGTLITTPLDGDECSVGLASVDENGAKIVSDCGVSASVNADFPPAPEEGYSPGTVASLADGALRVFVSALAPDGSAARLAVNGLDVQTIGSGETIDVVAGDQNCSLTVTGVGNGIVGLDGSCS